jgi:hypothetical protein
MRSYIEHFKFRFVAVFDGMPCGQQATGIPGFGLLRGSFGLLRACREQPRIKSGSVSDS